MEGTDLQKLIQLLAKLPGLGPRSGRRIALQLIKKRETLLRPLSEAMEQVADTIRTCGNLDTQPLCGICANANRDKSLLCVVEDIGDLWALERSMAYKGYYHVLGGTLSALDGRGPDDLTIEKLLLRAKGVEIKEIIMALNATVEGQTTIHYLTDRLNTECPDLKITHLAHGVPVGGELDYLDDGTLMAALRARRAA